MTAFEDLQEKLLDAREDENIKAYRRTFDKTVAMDPTEARLTAETEILLLTVDFISHGEKTPVGRMLIKALNIVVDTSPITIYDEEQRNATLRALYVAESVSSFLDVDAKNIQDKIQNAKETILHTPHSLALENARADAIQRSDTALLDKLNA